MLSAFTTPPRARQVLLAILVGGLAVVIRVLVQPWLGDELPFIIAVPAVILTTLIGGPVSGLIAGAICALGVWSPNIPPVLAPSEQLVEYSWFAISTLFIAFVCGQFVAIRHHDHSAISSTPSDSHLSAWLTAVLWGAASLPLLAFIALSWWSLDREQTKSERSLAHASDLAFRHAERTFEVAQGIALRADSASQFLKEQKEEREQEKEIHVRLSDMAAGLTSIVNTNVWDSDGYCIARSDQYPVTRFTIADRSYFQEQLNSPVPFGLSEVLVARQTGKQVINVTKRRQSANGKFNGIISVTLSPSYFVDYYQSLAAEERILSTFSLVRTDGAILAQWPGETESAPLHAGNSLIKVLAEGKKSGTAVLNSDGGRGSQTISYHRVRDLQMYVVSGVSRSAVIAEWARFVGLLAAIVLPITVGLVYVTWIAIRKTREEAQLATLLQEQIHARASAEKRVLEAQKLETLSSLTGSVAHDFNNLLSVISSSLHVHKKRRPEIADDKALDAMAKAVKTGVRLTRQLLSFSKKQALRPEVVKLQAWIPQVDTLLRTTLGSTATWTCVVQDDVRHVNVDVGELELALINLVFNAKLAMPRGGELSLLISNDNEAPVDAPMIIVCAIDTGDGISAEIMPKVFDPFFTTRPKGAGSGLGLTQVQSFCVYAGGHVSIKSALGKGTTVCLHIPAYLGQAAQVIEPQTADAGNLNAQVLLVEDNDDVARTTKQMLESSGMTVVRKEDADVAIAYLNKNASSTDIVLSDIAMPGSMNGIGFALHLRSSYPTLPVLLHTGYAEQLHEATSKGLRVLQKPVAPAVLLAELKAMLKSS